MSADSRARQNQAAAAAPSMAVLPTTPQHVESTLMMHRQLPALLPKDDYYKMFEDGVGRLAIYSAIIATFVSKSQVAYIPIVYGKEGANEVKALASTLHQIITNTALSACEKGIVNTRDVKETLDKAVKCIEELDFVSSVVTSTLIHEVLGIWGMMAPLAANRLVRLRTAGYDVMETTGGRRVEVPVPTLPSSQVQAQAQQQ